MNSLDIPGSNVTISRLGFGCARIAGRGERRRAAALIETALSCGIRHFDTAPAYGSEGMLGEVLCGVHGATIASKVGLPRLEDSEFASGILREVYRATVRPLLAHMPAVKSGLLRLATKSAPTAPARKRQLPRAVILRELDESLRLLRRPRIDLYLLHEPAYIEIDGELRDLFASLVNDGMIGAFGHAFGGQPDRLPPFGTVVQSRCDDSDSAARIRDVARIYHGVVRFGLQDTARSGVRRTAGQLIQEAMARHPEGAIIFSASSPHQIKEIAAACREAPSAMARRRDEVAPHTSDVTITRDTQ